VFARLEPKSRVGTVCAVWAGSYDRAVFLGEDLLPLLLLAFGAAMVVGSGLALVRPPQRRGADDLERPPVARSIAYIAIGLVVAVWALASLIAG
jgi:hypothetical protein